MTRQILDNPIGRTGASSSGVDGVSLPLPSGGDDTATIQTALSALTAGQKLSFQSGQTYKTTSTLTLPAISDCRIEGNGATIQASGAIAGPILDSPVGSSLARPVISGLILDCNQNARNGLYLRNFAHATIKDLEVWNSTQHAVVLGDTGASGSSFEAMISNLHIWRAQANAVPAGYYGLWMSNVTDSEVVQAVIVGSDVGVRNDGADNKFSHVHAWGYSGKTPSICFDDNSGGGAWYVNCTADTPTTYGYRMRQAGSKIFGGQIFNGTFGGSDNVMVGIQIDANTAAFVVIGVTFAGADGSHRIAKAINYTNGSRAILLGNGYSNVVTAQQEILQIQGSGVGLTVQNNAGTGFVATQGGNKSLQLWNGALIEGFTDIGSTQTFKLDASIGTLAPKANATASRPSASTAGVGAMSYDSTLSKPIWSDGTTWRDATGTAV